MKPKIITIAYHRNGIAGEPFHVVLFDDNGDRMVGIVFEEPAHCAVLNVALLSAGDIGYGSNSWRGDSYETALRESIAAASASQRQGNRERGRRASQILSTYGNDEPRCNVIDLLTDLMHWCDQEFEDFEQCCGRAAHHFGQETTDDIATKGERP